MSVYMVDDNAVIGEVEDIKKRIRNYRRIETEKNSVWIKEHQILLNA